MTRQRVSSASKRAFAELWASSDGDRTLCEAWNAAVALASTTALRDSTFLPRMESHAEARPAHDLVAAAETVDAKRAAITVALPVFRRAIKECIRREDRP